jgi:hypothetical protein
MNPISRKNPLDADKFRQQYLNNLQLQASNDQLNLNANQIFKNTGQTPTQPTDLRTTTEKIADIEGLKRELRSFLASSGILNSGNANEVVQQLTQVELGFLLQYKDFIKADFKGRGVPTQVFVDYIRALKNKTDLTNGVDFGLQQATGDAILLSNQQILGGMATADQLDRLHMIIHNIPNTLGIYGLRGLVEKIDRDITEMKDTIPTREELDRIAGLAPAIRGDIQILLNSALEDIPTKDDLADATGAIIQAIEHNDARALQRELSALDQILAENEGVKEQIDLVRSELKRQIEDTEEELLYQINSQGATAEKVPSSAKKSREVPDEITREADWDKLYKDTKIQFLNDKGLLSKKTGYNLEQLDHIFYTQYFNKKAGRNDASASQGHTEEESTITIIPKKRTGGHGLIGRGLTKVITEKKKYYPKPSATSRSDGYEKPKPYSQFGSMLINRHRLTEGILMLKRPSGTSKPDLKSQAISPTMVKVIRSLMNGKPDLELINDLDKNEQALLHKVVKHSHYELVSVPNPHKTAEAKEMDRFNILRGEILAGNDNKTLVKEFKTLLMRFLQEGRIPKRQAHDILTDLTAMGF